MTILLAAIDDSATCRPILEIALWASKVVGAQLVAVHVQSDGSGETARATAESLDVPFVVRSGEIVEEICAARLELHAIALAIGARSFPGGSSPAGHVALEIAQKTPVPVIIVPPDVTRDRVDRILIALERNGDNAVVLSLAEQLSPFEDRDIVAVHVFSPESLPPFSDDPTFETETWTRELLRQASNTAAARVHMAVRVGDPALQVSEAVRELHADLVVLAWHRDLSEGHAQIVRRVLETSHVPLVLLNAQAIDTPVSVAQERKF